MPKVLVVATSRKTRGGITSVVKAHETGEQWKRYHCRWIETHRDGNSLRKLWYLATALIEFLCLVPSYDIVHIHMSEPVSALRKLPFMFWARLWRKKTIVHFHSFSPETTIRSRYAWVYRYLFCNADAVVALSEYWKCEIGRKFNMDNKVRVIYNPCTTYLSGNGTFADAEVVVGKKQILYAGTVNARKGYADMLRAFAKIAKRHEDWIITFAGNGEIENGKRMADELGISSQVLWLGWVNGADKDRAFREASVFCLPSYAEGFPMAVLDAWSYGLPVITTPVGGIPDVARDGENMLLFEPGDVDGLARQMERMISDAELRGRISRESLNFAKTMFNIKTINVHIEELYDELLQIVKQ